MRQKAVQRFFVALIVAVCAIWTGSAFTFTKKPASEAKPSAIKKLDLQLGIELEKGVRNMYGLP